MSVTRRVGSTGARGHRVMGHDEGTTEEGGAGDPEVTRLGIPVAGRHWMAAGLRRRSAPPEQPRGERAQRQGPRGQHGQRPAGHDAVLQRRAQRLTERT